MITVIGHKNPDADSYCTALAVAHLLNLIGRPAEARAQGTANPETQFILNFAGIDTPKELTDATGKQLWLVDHSDWAQAPKQAKKATVVGITDHHKLGDITTNSPLDVWIRPVGCSSTVTYQMYNAYNVVPSTAIAKVMLCAIISDTLNFTSPTCTQEDIDTASALQQLADISSMQDLVDKQFHAKSDISNSTPFELFHRDLKTAEYKGYTVAVGQFETTSLVAAEKLIPTLKELTADYMINLGHHTCMMLITDIIQHNSTALVYSNNPELLEKHFAQPIIDHVMSLPGVVSRKKQVTPLIGAMFDDLDIE